MRVKISEIFTSIQGEGRWAGHPAVFIRLAGCSVKCHFCDTKHAQTLPPEDEWWEEASLEDFESRSKNDWISTTVDRVARYVAGLIEKSSKEPTKRIQMIVITGGEPFEQPDALLELCQWLPTVISNWNDGVTPFVQICIETSGTAPITDSVKKIFDLIAQDEGHFLTVSPKYKAVRMEYVYAANQLKFLVGAEPKKDVKIPQEVFEHVQDRCEGVCFQPIDYGHPNSDKAAIQRAIEKAYEHGGTVSVQIHKLLGIR